MLHTLFCLFCVIKCLAGVWNETSSGNRTLKINESVIRYFIKCFKTLDRKPVLYTKRNCMTIVKPVYVHVLHVVNKPERTNIYSCITWFRHTKRRLVIQYACLIWISTKKSESWGFANGSREHIHKVPLNTFGNVKLPFNFIHTISQTIE